MLIRKNSNHGNKLQIYTDQNVSITVHKTELFKHKIPNVNPNSAGHKFDNYRAVFYPQMQTLIIYYVVSVSCCVL